ncbi:MAG: hypothetical protein ACKORL_05310, partial [Phycisphaerales bacterium]
MPQTEFLAAAALAFALVPTALSQTVERAMASPFRPVPGAGPAHLAGSVAARPGLSGTSRRRTCLSAAIAVQASATGSTAATLPARCAGTAPGTVEGDEAGRAMLARSAAGTMGFVQTSGGTAILSGPPAGVAGPLASF